jgi:phosphonate degradation associated HDIG domain protein
MTPDQIVELYLEHGHIAYEGEGVTQLEHALQCAQLALRAGVHDALIVASLLHDIGHLVNRLGASPSLRGLNDMHEQVAADTLSPHFIEAVVEPIRLHVEAKRYLCQVEPTYRAALSPDSTRSLELQGGPLDAASAAAFIARPWAADAVRLRRWDDGAKRRAAAVPPLSEFIPLLKSCAH